MNSIVEKVLYEIGVFERVGRATALGLVAEAERLEALVQSKQAEIDRLMLEYCPADMTAEQLRSWGDHQVPAASANAPSSGSSGVTQRILRDMWREAGGEFHGPHIETGCMPEAKLLCLLKELYHFREINSKPVDG